MENPPLRLEYLSPSQLAAHPANWKFHPPDQLEAIERLHGRVGFAGALLLNERTGLLLDGHGRKQLFEGKSSPVPVLIGSWDEDQEREILAGLDPTGWSAITDREKFSALLSGDNFPPLQDSGELGKLLESVRSTAARLGPDPEPPADDDRKDDSPEITLALDSIWPTDNPWGVPTLLLEMQAEQVPAPVTSWGSIGMHRVMPGTWHHYIDDYKFEPLWRRPHNLLHSHPSATTEPNFSTTGLTPGAIALFGIYRKRWLARYWQSQGVRIFVDLNVDASLNSPSDTSPPDAVGLNLLGVPRGWKAYSTRAHGNNPDALVDEWRVAQRHSGIDHPLFLCVGGGRRVKALAEQHGWVHVPENRGQDRPKTVSQETEGDE